MPRPNLSGFAAAAILALGAAGSLFAGQAVAMGSATGTHAAARVGARSAGSSGRPAGRPLRLFAPDSVWNEPLSPAAPLDPSSAARMSAFTRLIAAEEQAGTGPWIEETSYSTPFYVVGPEQPRVGVQLDDGPWAASLQSALDAGVPIPASAEPAAGTDGELTVYQPSSDTLWEFWRATRTASGWQASWGGAMQDVSESPGYYTDDSWPGLAPAQGWNWGATATSLPAIAGVIRIPELRAGRIEHALALDVPNACAHQFSFPAQRSDGSEESPACIPEGAHLRLDPSLDLASLHLSPIADMLAVAAQRYGVVVRDITHHDVGFYAEAPAAGSDPYLGARGLFDGLKPGVFLREFPWGALRLLRLHLCSSAPCLG